MGLIRRNHLELFGVIMAYTVKLRAKGFLVCWQAGCPEWGVGLLPDLFVKQKRACTRTLGLC